MKRNRFLNRLYAMAAALMLCCFCLPHIPAMPAQAADGRLYNQNDAYWQTVKFTRYSNSGNSMYTSGCGIFSFCNAIYALNSGQINPQELGQWGVDNGGYRPGAGGLYRDIFYQDLERDWGARYSFHIEGRYSGSVTDERLKNHLKNGGVAVIHVPNHFMALSGYNPNNGLYHVLESAVFTGRGLSAESWVDANKLSSGRTSVSWYALISNTKAPGFSRVSIGSSRLFAVGETIDFTLDSDTRSSYGLGINAEDGHRVQTLYNLNTWEAVTRHIQTSLQETGIYSCYVTSHSGVSGLDSAPLSFEVYRTYPINARIQPPAGRLSPGQPYTLRVLADFAISFQLFIEDTVTGRTFDSGIITTDLHRCGYNYNWIPEHTGQYRARVKVYNAYGTMTSKDTILNVVGVVPVFLDANGGTANQKKIDVVFGERYGTLPVPERSGYNFDGWFTMPAGGTRVTEDTVVETSAEHWLYAHWSVIPQETDAPVTTTTVTTTTTTTAVTTEAPQRPTACKPVDLNQDGVCDAADVYLVYRIVSEDPDYAPQAEVLEQADVNADGSIDLIDLQLLLMLGEAEN
ncbi:MAG TPA: hypothetical protein DCG49_00380 [Ruminococcus sp.]|nr:hypothetical protein [Ruminococcus sp.]